MSRQTFSSSLHTFDSLFLAPALCRISSPDPASRGAQCHVSFLMHIKMSAKSVTSWATTVNNLYIWNIEVSFSFLLIVTFKSFFTLLFLCVLVSTATLSTRLLATVTLVLDFIPARLGVFTYFCLSSMY